MHSIHQENPFQMHAKIRIGAKFFYILYMVGMYRKRVGK